MSRFLYPIFRKTTRRDVRQLCLPFILPYLEANDPIEYAKIQSLLKKGKKNPLPFF